MVGGMSNEQQHPDEPARHHGDGGAKYPPPPVLTDEERERYDKGHAEILERLKQQKRGCRSRWRPPS